MIRQKIVRFLIENNILVNPDVIDKIPEENFNISLFYKKVIENKERINDDILLSIIRDIVDNSLSIVDSHLALDYEENIDKTLKKFNIKLINNYVKDAQKKEISSFVSYYNKRFDQLATILRNRAELSGVVSISRLKNNQRHFESNSKQKETVALIGMVLDKQETKNGHLMFTIEDRSGTFKVLITKNNEELFSFANDIMCDEVIGVAGSLGNDIIYAESILMPDVPKSKELKKSPTDDCAIFLSDPHIGSKQFKEKEFKNFIDWLNLEYDDDKQRAIAKKVKYLFIVGDLVEGIGIFPSQEQDVLIKDIYLQYEEAFRLLSQIRKDVCIIITPGNHDPMRIAEPQPMHYKSYAKKLYELENVVFLSSPSMLSVGANEKFDGIDVLLYHGFSIPYYADQVPSIRKAGGMKRVDLVLKYFLERRHLAPTHTSTQFVPDTDYDHLAISRVPDIFATGHIHMVSRSTYNNVTCLNCSCWIGPTDYQTKLGIEPQPSRAILVDLHTRQTGILKFGEE